MKFKIGAAAAALAGILFHVSVAAQAPTDARSYAVLSLIGDAIHVDSVREAVGTRVPAESHGVLKVTDQVFDMAALLAANASIKQVQPGARIVLMTTQDAELYQAQNAMFELPDVNQANRAYLLELLKDRGVSHLLLVTKQRDHAYFKLDNGSLGTGQLEGLGFYIDDTSNLLNRSSSNSGRGMVGPFAYVKIRLLDAKTLALVDEIKVNKSSIIFQASVESNAMEIWNSMASADKVDRINGMLGEAVKEAIVPLLRK